MYLLAIFLINFYASFYITCGGENCISTDKKLSFEQPYRSKQAVGYSTDLYVRLFKVNQNQPRLDFDFRRYEILAGCFKRLIDFWGGFIDMRSKITKIVSHSQTVDDAFVSLLDGTICKIGAYSREWCFPPKILIQKNNAHQGAIVDIEAALYHNAALYNFERTLISAGEDGFIRLWDTMLEEKVCYDFKTNIGSAPRYIHYLYKSNLVLVESEEKDYVYFNPFLFLVDKISHTDIKKLLITENHILVAKPEVIRGYLQRFTD